MQLRDSDPRWLRARFTVVMQPLVHELRGVAKDGDDVSVSNWREKRELARVPAKNCTGVAFTASGGLVTAAWGDDTLRIWAWRAEDLVADACWRLERNLTREEWQTYLGSEPYRKTCPDLPTPEN